MKRLLKITLAILIVALIGFAVLIYVGSQVEGVFDEVTYALGGADFRNDAIDTGEVGVGHSVTALYELKFQPDAPERQPALTVHVRYTNPESGEVVEISRALARADFYAAFAAAPIRFQLDAVVAEYAEILRDSYWAKDASLGDVAREARRVAEALPEDADVQEFANLVARATELSGTR